MHSEIEEKALHLINDAMLVVEGRKSKEEAHENAESLIIEIYKTSGCGKENRNKIEDLDDAEREMVRQFLIGLCAFVSCKEAMNVWEKAVMVKINAGFNDSAGN